MKKEKLQEANYESISRSNFSYLVLFCTFISIRYYTRLLFWQEYPHIL